MRRVLACVLYGLADVLDEIGGLLWRPPSGARIPGVRKRVPPRHPMTLSNDEIDHGLHD